jgi:hypothetical protein
MHPKQKIHKNKDYLAWIRRKPCLACGKKGPNDAHHVWNSGKKNSGNDFLAAPLCRSHHTFDATAYHNMGHDKFEYLWNIDFKDEIINLLTEYLEEISRTYASSVVADF